MTRCWLALTTALILGACGVIQPGGGQEFQVAVQQTLAALPTNPGGDAAISPTATIVPLKGLFCEYEFCIGHPAGMALFDVVAKNNPTSPTASTFGSGDLAAVNETLFIEVKWQSAPNGSDGQFMLDNILQDSADQRNGDVTAILLRNLNVYFVPITSTASPQLPYGGAAAWVCGARAFAWKTYSTQPDLAKNLLLDSLQAFRCD